MDLKNETPSKSKVVNKVLNPMNCDSPFRLLPNVSTPPSRFARIFNPFEPHLIERLHLPTISPSVFAQMSTPKTDKKFKWTIDDISSLKPADIDENTLSQHVSENDPTIESMVQEKIDKFFSEKAIVPSPLSEGIKQMPLISDPLTPPKHFSDNSAQTVMTLPPNLPKHVEDVLAPYFTYTNDQQEQNMSLYKQLFEFEEHSDPASSPAPSTGLSPIQFSPEFNLRYSSKDKLESTMEMPELRDCTLSPIGRSPMSRSACRLSFSAHMSVDASMVVPDVDKGPNYTNLEDDNSFQPLEGGPSDSLVNWDVEYKQVSILSRSPVSSPERIDSSNSNTPHSRIFTSQRKRLSESFKNEDVEMDDVQRQKNRLNNSTDAGYQTGATLSDNSLLMFASTPTKNKH